MPNFAYRALDPTGKHVAGTLDAPDRRGAVQRLSSQGLRPLSIDAQAGRVVRDDTDDVFETLDLYKSDRKQKRSLFRISQSEVGYQFLKRLHVLLTAGMSIGDAVRLLSQRLSDPVLKELSADVWRRLSEGRSLHSALADYPEIFSASQLHLLEAGETSGNLVPVIERMLAYMEEVKAVRMRLVSSLAYPALVLSVVAIVVIIMVTFLMPRIQQILDQLGGEPPMVTVIILQAAEIFKFYGPIALGLLLLGIFALVRWRRTEAGRRATDAWLLRLPLINRVYLYANIFATTNLMATLLSSGVNTTETLRLVERTILNRVLRAKFAAARKQIQEGVSMATAIQRVHYMPDLAMDILTVGENTGSVSQSLQDINRIYRGELTRRLNLLTNGLVIVAMGSTILMVGVIAASIVLTLLGVSQSLQR